MERLSTMVSEDQFDWVEKTADKREISKAALVREVIRVYRNEDDDPTDDTQDRINDIEDRLNRLEDFRDRLGVSETTGRGQQHGHGHEDPAVGIDDIETSTADAETQETEANATADDRCDEAGDQDGEVDHETIIEEVREYLIETKQPPKTPHGREAVLDMISHLQAHDTGSTAALKDMLYPEYDEHYKNPSAMWEAIRRYFEDIPGIEKPGQGTYEYPGDSETRKAIQQGAQ